MLAESVFYSFEVFKYENKYLSYKFSALFDNCLQWQESEKGNFWFVFEFPFHFRAQLTRNYYRYYY